MAWRKYVSYVYFTVLSSRIATSPTVVCRSVFFAVQTLVSAILVGTSSGLLVGGLFVALQSRKTSTNDTSLLFPSLFSMFYIGRLSSTSDIFP